MPSTLVGGGDEVAGGDPAGGVLALVSSAISANNIVELVFRGLLTFDWKVLMSCPLPCSFVTQNITGFEEQVLVLFDVLGL